MSYKCYYDKFCRFIIKNRNNIFRIKITNSDNAYFLITPWQGTPLPFYFFALALIYRLYKRTEVTLVINDMLYKSKLHVRYAYDTKYIMKLSQLAFLIKGINVIRLSKVPAKIMSDKEKGTLKFFAKQNAIIYLRSSQENDRFKRVYKEYYKELYPVAERINSLFDNHNISYMVIPGGAFQETALIAKKCEEKGVDYYTYDSGEECILVGINSVASRIWNTVETYKEITRNNTCDYFSQEAYKLLNIRKGARNEEGFFRDIVQTCSYEDKETKLYDIIIFPNIEHEASAIASHQFYESDSEWLIRTIEYILDNTKYTIAVREHPMVRNSGNRNALIYLQKKYGKNKRFKFISYKDIVNSYQLINETKVILVNTSTIGLESAMMGKWVITESNSYYSDMNFVIKCNSEKDYFNAIVKAVDSIDELKVEDRKAASIFYGLTQLCNWVRSVFTAQNMDYDKWINKDFQTIIKSQETAWFIESLLTKEPIMKIKYKGIYDKNSDE